MLTTIRYFRNEYEAHIRYKKCPSVACKEIISSPCQHACPINTEASVYISLIAAGRFDVAFDIIHKDNPLPSVCARVCHHPCETKCQASKWGDSIAIRDLKKFAVEYAIKTGRYTASKNTKTSGEKVAIIGSGPGGLTAGNRLNQLGYDVTIFEAENVPGGALSMYIPEYRLPADRIMTDITYLKNSGIKIITGTKIGRDLLFDEILADYRAVFIATGAGKSRKLHIKNEDAAGVIDALDFLKKINFGHIPDLGGRVGIIGGGNAAIDAARSALRHGQCESVHVIYRRTIAEMPAFREEIESALEEGITIRFLESPVRIISENGRITGVECVKMELGERDASGRKRPIPVENSEFIIELDTLVIAIGETPDTSFLDKSHHIETSKWGSIIVHSETNNTSREGVFAGGDVVTGPSTVLEAMASGKNAAEMIDKFIRGEHLEKEYRLTRPSMYLPPVTLTDEEIEHARRPPMLCLPVNERVDNYHEVELNLPVEMAVREARRCLRCDLETKDGKTAIQEYEASEHPVKTF